MNNMAWVNIRSPGGGVTPPPNWQPRTPPMQQNQQGIQGA